MRKGSVRTAEEKFIPVAMPAAAVGRSASIEVLLATGARLIVGEDTDLALLKRVMAALS